MVLKRLLRSVEAEAYFFMRLAFLKQSQKIWDGSCCELAMGGLGRVVRYRKELFLLYRRFPESQWNSKGSDKEN